jgi:RNA polymerase sigma-70 factor (ECF subfamily)
VVVEGVQGAGGAPGRGPAPRPDKQLEGVELEQIMQRCIAGLDEEHRVVVVLRDVEDLSYEEICAITNLPVGTVKSRLHRARLALKKMMLEHM